MFCDRSPGALELHRTARSMGTMGLLDGDTWLCTLLDCQNSSSSSRCSAKPMGT